MLAVTATAPSTAPAAAAAMFAFALGSLGRSAFLRFAMLSIGRGSLRLAGLIRSRRVLARMGFGPSHDGLGHAGIGADRDPPQSA